MFAGDNAIINAYVAGEEEEQVIARIQKILTDNLAFYDITPSIFASLEIGKSQELLARELFASLEGYYQDLRDKRIPVSELPAQSEFAEQLSARRSVMMRDFSGGMTAENAQLILEQLQKEQAAQQKRRREAEITVTTNVKVENSLTFNIPVSIDIQAEYA